MSPRFAGGMSGALAALALPPFPLWPAVFVALVPLSLALARSGLRRTEVVGAGVAFGLFFYLPLLHWAPATLHGLVPLGVVSGVLLIGILVGLAGFQALLLHHLLARRGAPVVLALPAVWVSTELLLAHSGPLAFPWLPLALALAPVPELAGIAESGGTGLVSLWIAVVNGGVAATLAAVSRPRRAMAALTLSVALLPAGWGIVRAGTLPLQALPPILLVQMDLPRSVLLDPPVRDRLAGEALDRILEGWRPESEGPAPVLAVLPEAPFAASWNGPMEARFREHAAALDLPILVGARLDDDRRNGVMRVEAGASARSLHAKVRLVPGVERPGTPPGPRGGVTEVGGIRLGFLICFESAFGAEAQRLRREGAQLLVNPSNDGWFRPAWPAGGSAGLAQHRAHLILRAVASRTGAVRASLGGELLVIDPRGRVILSRPPGGEGILPVRPVTSTAGAGFPGRGELGGALGLLLLFGLLVPRRRAAAGLRDR